MMGTFANIRFSSFLNAGTGTVSNIFSDQSH